MSDADFGYVSVWECPNCGITENAGGIGVPKTTVVEYYCSHCGINGFGEYEMQVKERQETDE